MSRRSQNSDASVSLFPFLAVLVCAMGALIFLLLVTVKQIREQAIQKQKSKETLVEKHSEEDVVEPEIIQSKPAIVESVDPIEDQPATVNNSEPVLEEDEIASEPIEPDDFPKAEDIAIKLPEQSDDELIADAERLRQQRIQEQQDQLDADWSRRLSKVRDELETTTKTSKAASDEFQLLEASIQQKLSDYDSLRSQMTRANTDLLLEKSEVEKVETESLAVMDDIQQLRQKLDETRKTKKQVGSKYQFIPYDGITGTTRRPIFIECNAKGLQFQPEGVTITAADVQGFSSYYNPVLIGTRALVHFWKQTDARNKSSNAPYVLLVVKPEGTMAFYAARKLLKDLRVPYGYELVENEFPLDYPEKNNDAEKALKEAIVEVLKQRNKVASSILGDGDAATNNRGKGFSKPTQRPSLEDRLGGSNRSPVEPGKLGKRQMTGSNIGTSPNRQNKNTNPTGERRSPFDSRSQAKSREFGSPKNLADQFPKIEPLPQMARSKSESSTSTSRLVPPSPNQENQQQPEYRLRPQFPSSSSNAVSAGSSDAMESAFNNKQQWGVQNQSAKIGIEKTIRIRIEPHQITVGNLKPFAVGKGESVEQLQEEVLKRIDQHARSWGAPPRSFYWSPYLKCEISPGGNRHFDRIERRFRQLNLKTVAEPVFTARPDFIESLR